jgi:pimeloyl-ACP methyl ester carboxylesterase
VAPRAGAPYQVAALDLHGVLAQFGFVRPVLLGECLGCLPVVLVAAWFPQVVGRVILVDAACRAPDDARLEARALRECPPDWPALRAELRCAVLELRADDPGLVSSVEAFLEAPLP